MKQKAILFSLELEVTIVHFFALFKKRLSWPVIIAIMDNTVQLTGMILLLLIGAFSLNFVLSATIYNLVRSE